MRNVPFLFTLALLIIGCNSPEQGAVPSTGLGADIQPEVQTNPVLSDDARDDWRKGDSLIATMGSLEGKVVADLFAGDGYYTWKLLSAGARVLAIDDDPAAIASLNARKVADGIGDDRLIVRATTPGIVGLLPNEADLALITREVSTLGDRPAWFAQLFSGVKPPTTIYIVNFLPGSAQVGPPLNQRMDYETVRNELNAYGFTDVGILYKRLPYRYILFARIAQESPGQP
ncbi:MAG: class I SAM-dependent methyltransferase [Flavobacteriales bacterium]